MGFAAYLGGLRRARLYDLVRTEGLSRTLEVGLAHGLSSLFIAQAHHDAGGGHHVAIDPCQSSWFGRCGTKNIEEAGLADYVEVIEAENYVVLPRLFSTSPGRFQLIFIDGLHIFDHVLLDFFYSDLLLEVGGYIVFDDTNLPAVKDALSFIVENRFDSYERVQSLSCDRITVLRKLAEDCRIEKHGVMFHRAFSSEVSVPGPLPPPPSPSVLKHGIDRAFAMVGIIALAPVGLLVAAAIVLEDLLRGRRPMTPLDRAARVSAGRQFDLLRFRILKSRGGRGARLRQGGVSKVGMLIKRLGLANVPSLWNVLVGRMSIVGPRPIPVGDRRTRALFRACGLRSGLTGLHHLKSSPISDFEYYEEYSRRSSISLLAFDLSVVVRAVLKRARLPFSHGSG